ncbi:MAG: ABC transporter permease [Akkermansiaceae bacterium]
MPAQKKNRVWRVRPEWPFLLFLLSLVAAYLSLVILMVGANVFAASWDSLLQTLANEEIQSAIGLSFRTSLATALLSVLVAVPVGYFMSRFEFRGKALLDSLIDVPVLLPPLTVGLSLLLIFNQLSLSTTLGILAMGFVISFFGTWVGKAPRQVVVFFGLVTVILTLGAFWWLDEEVTAEGALGEAGIPVTFRPIAVVLAQFPVAAAFSIRMMRTHFDEINPRLESVAMTLGCHRGMIFRQVILPISGRAVLAAGTMAWARALGEFGPILVFAGATRGRTEVLSTSVYLELTIGNISGAAALSLLMIALAVSAIFATRLLIGKGGRG